MVLIVVPSERIDLLLRVFERRKLINAFKTGAAVCGQDGASVGFPS